jgi:uncharacterized protein YjaZ
VTALSAKDDPKPLYTKNAADKAIIEKIIGYLQTAKSEGYDDNVPSMSIPTNLADIQLKAGSVLTLSPAAKDRVYVFMSSIKKTIRVFSPELSDWLYTGWKKDITKKH